MLDHPFKLFDQFKDHLQVSLFTKQDSPNRFSDTDAGSKLNASKTAALWQVHDNRTIIVRDAVDRDEQADGMATDQKDLALIIRWADCQNFVVYEPEKNVAGLLHVGWRGLLAGAIPEFFKVINNEWGIQAQDCFVGAGPSLCLQCAGFDDLEHEMYTVKKEFIHDAHVDLPGVAEDQLWSAGVQKDRFERLPDCTRCNPDTYWTYRGGHKEEVQEGRTNALACVLM